MMRRYACWSRTARTIVTPYFGTQLVLDQLSAYGSADRVKLSVYAAGTCSTTATPRERASTTTRRPCPPTR